MQNIGTQTVLSRVTAELPNGLRIATEAFQEGWNFVRSGDVHQLDKAIQKCGWHFIWIAEASQHAGVGQTEQAAIASALKLALRRVGPGFNAASVDRVDISHYPWFFIAKVKIYPYQIQESSALQESNQVTAIRMAASSGETPLTNLSATAI